MQVQLLAKNLFGTVSVQHRPTNVNHITEVIACKCVCETVCVCFMFLPVISKDVESVCKSFPPVSYVSLVTDSEKLM